MKSKIINYLFVLLLLSPMAFISDVRALESVQQAIENQDFEKNSEKESITKKVDAFLDENSEDPSIFDEDNVWATFFRSIMMLLAVLGLIYLVLQKGLGKLVQKQHQGRRMQVLERINLESKRSVLLLRIDDRDILFASAEGGVALMDLGLLSKKNKEETNFAEVLSKSPKQDSVSDDFPSE